MALKVSNKLLKPSIAVKVNEKAEIFLRNLGLLARFNNLKHLASNAGYTTAGVITAFDSHYKTPDSNDPTEVYHVTMSLAAKNLHVVVPLDTFHVIRYYHEATDKDKFNQQENIDAVRQYLLSFMADVTQALKNTASPTMQLIAKSNEVDNSQEDAEEDESTSGDDLSSDLTQDLPEVTKAVAHNEEVPYTVSEENTLASTLEDLINHSSPYLESDPELHAKELSDATLLYEPVFGTNTGSRYHVVLITSTGVKMAARYTNGVLALKAIVPSGAVYDACKEHLSEMGFAVKQKGHLSVHYQSITPTVARKTLYAALSGFDPDTIVTGLPILEKFEKYGV